MAEMKQSTQVRDPEPDCKVSPDDNDPRCDQQANNAQLQDPLTLDQLDYLADLVSELRDLSNRAGFTTLAGILALAQTEANTQMAQIRVRFSRD